MADLCGLYLLQVSPERTGERKPIPFQEIAYQDQDGAVSPDGRWMLYSSEQRHKPMLARNPF